MWQPQKSKRIFVCLLMAGLLVPAGVRAQDIETGSTVERVEKTGRWGTPAHSGGGYFIYELHQFDTQGLNNALDQAGLPTLSGQIATLGGGGASWVGDWMFGGYGGSLLVTGQDRNGYAISGGGGFGAFQVGYRVYAHRSLSLFPLIGFGGGGFGVTVEPVINGTFEDKIKGFKDGTVSGNKLDFGTGGVFFQAALGLEYMVISSSEWEKDASGGMVLGLRAGYQVAPYWGGMWQIENGPDMGITGPFLQLTIGGGGFDREYASSGSAD